MGYMDSSTSTITSVLTTKGREALARNDSTFRITKFKLGDDEINYQLYNIGNIDSEDNDILAIPILEPSTNPDSALRFPLVTLPEGTKRVAELSISPQNVILNLSSVNNIFTAEAATLYNQDSYYLVSFNNINSTFVNSVAVTQYSTTHLVNNQSSLTFYEYLVQADSDIQSSKAKWNVAVTLKKNDPRVVDSTPTTNSEDSTVVGSPVRSNILLFTMIVLGKDSGAFTTLDIYGNTGGRVVVDPNVNDPRVVDQLQQSSNNTIIGGNS